MPRENKKRGRREEKKRRRRDDEAERPTKRRRPDFEVQEDFVPMDEMAEEQAPGLEEDRPDEEKVFYGLLDEQEQEYFKQADQMLDANTFADDEERSLFLDNVYREANGKELKMANSQSCSRLMERLILMSTPAQLKGLFGKFSGQ